MFGLPLNPSDIDRAQKLSRDARRGPLAMSGGGQNQLFNRSNSVAAAESELDAPGLVPGHRRSTVKQQIGTRECKPEPRMEPQLETVTSEVRHFSVRLLHPLDSAVDSRQ
jgi:hypothetical protein